MTLLLLHHLWQQALVIWICLFRWRTGTALATCQHQDHDHHPDVHPSACLASHPARLVFLQAVLLLVFSCFTSAPKRASQACTLHNSDLSALTGGSCVLLCHKSSRTVEIPAATPRFTTRSVQIALLHTARVACSSSFVWFFQDARDRPENP